MRLRLVLGIDSPLLVFPYFFVGTFIEALIAGKPLRTGRGFPYFFVGTFIEAKGNSTCRKKLATISLLFRRDFH